MNRNIKKSSSVVLSGISLLVLASCLPQDEANLSENSLRNIESQVQLYSGAFQQYANKSLNAVVNSAAWNSGTLPEGVIDLANPMFGTNNMGNAEAYLESAHCTNGGNSFHLTWFDSADAAGDISLKGLGESHIGQTNNRIKSMISHANFGIYNGTNIQMGDGTTFTLSGNCNALSLPVGTAVSAISMPAPQNILVATETRTILRASACPVGQEGGITESVNADFFSEPFDGVNSVRVGASGYVDEQDVIDNHATWNTISNDCIGSVVAQTLTSNSDTVDIIDLSSLITTSDIGNALSALEDVDCRQTNVDSDPNANNSAQLDMGYDSANSRTQQQQSSNSPIVDTCGTTDTIDSLDQTNVVQRRLLSSDITPITTSCPAAPVSAVVRLTNARFRGLPRTSDGQTVNLTRRGVTGSVVVNRIVERWDVTTDYGDGRGAQSSVVTTTRFEGVDLNCQGQYRTSLTCAQLRPSAGATITGGTTAIYEQSYNQVGWNDTARMAPQTPTYGGFSLISGGGCTYQETRTVNVGCPSGQTGSRTQTQVRTGTPAGWGGWSNTGSPSGTCRSQNTGGGGSNGGGQQGYDADGDGRSDNARGDGDASGSVSDGW